jgi:ribosomal protein L25 (general stress protein Ctc)
MDKIGLIELNTEELGLISDNEDIELVRQSIAEIKDLQMATTIPQWEYTLEKSLLNEHLQYPTDDNRYLQCKLQIHGVVSRVIDRHYNFNKLTAEIEILQSEIDNLQKKLFKGKRIFAEIKLKQNDVMLKKYQIHSLKYLLGQDLMELKNFQQLLKKYNPESKIISLEKAESDRMCRMVADEIYKKGGK